MNPSETEEESSEEKKGIQKMMKINIAFNFYEHNQSTKIVKGYIFGPHQSLP